MLRSYQRLLLTCCLLFSVAAEAQTSMNDLAANFIEHIRADRKEKLVVLTDKQYYAAGERLWLKAWCLDSLSHRFLFLSKNLYVDLVNDKDSVISQLLFDIPRRKTAGMILLPATLPEGYYWLRAYTKKILEEGSGRILVKPIYIVNPDKPNPRSLSEYTPKITTMPEDTAAPRVLFYPEGGSIISGTTATVGFRSIGSSGEPVDVSGYVTDPLHDSVAHFSCVLPGRGKFSFDAYNPRKYTAHIRWRGRELLYPLPGLDQFAYQLSVIGRDDRTLHLQVSLGDSLYKKNKATKLLAVSRDSLCFAANGNDMYQVNVPIASLPLGEVSFFLFDDRDRMVSQRSVYIGSSDSGRIQAATDKSNYSPGERVNLSIGVNQPNDHPPVVTLLSVAVTDDRVTGERGAAGELGEVASIAGLATEPGGTAAAPSADVLMLTEPPIDTDWKYRPGTEPAMTVVRSADSNLLNIRGTAVGKDNAPLQHYIVNLVSGDNHFFMADTTDTEGRFKFPLDEYDDGTRFNIKLTSLQGKAVGGKLILDKMDYPNLATPTSLKQGLSPREIALVRRFRSTEASQGSTFLRDSTMLKPATVQTGRKKLPDYDEAKRASNFSDIITPDQFRNGGVDAVYNALSNIPGFTSAINRTFSNSSMSVDPFLILMDGVPVDPGGDLKSFLESIDASNVEFIEVLKGPLTAIYGMQGAGGVILINSVNGRKDVAQTNDKGLTTIYPKGYYSQPAEFASGWDRKKGAENAPTNDQPSTLYWNANVLTDKDGKATVGFFTGHQQAVYSAAIVGITMGGEIVEGRTKFRCQ